MPKTMQGEKTARMGIDLFEGIKDIQSAYLGPLPEFIELTGGHDAHPVAGQQIGQFP